MTINDLIQSNLFESVCIGEDTNRQLTIPYCCDLLSIAMSKAPEGCAWVTVMGNINTLAVAALTDCGCIILAEGALLDEAAMAKAVQQKITVLKTQDPIFTAALSIYKRMEQER